MLQHKNHLQYLSLIPEQDSFISIYKIYILKSISIRAWLHVPNISISMHPIVLFLQCNGEWMRERDFHFQSPIYFLEYCIEY